MNKFHEERLKWTENIKLQTMLPDSPHDLVFVIDDQGIIRDQYWQYSGASWPECWLYV